MKSIDKDELFLAQKGLCFYCFRPMSRKSGCSAVYTKDHFRPKSKGYKSNGNTVLAHAKCNLQKGHRNPTESELVRFKVLTKRIKERNEAIKRVREDLFNKRDL